MEELLFKKLGTNELDKFIDLIRVFEDVFEMEDFSMPDATHLLRILQKQSFLVFVAVLEDKVVGGLTTYILDQYYSEKPLAYIYDLAVKQEFQRRGIGGKLIEAINAYCREQGFEEVFVQSDRVDDYALDFYRSTPFSQEEEVVHFCYKL